MLQPNVILEVAQSKSIGCPERSGEEEDGEGSVTGARVQSQVRAEQVQSLFVCSLHLEFVEQVVEDGQELFPVPDGGMCRGFSLLMEALTPGIWAFLGSQCFTHCWFLPEMFGCLARAAQVFCCADGVQASLPQ